MFYILTVVASSSTDVLSTLLFRNALSNNLAGYATSPALVMALAPPWFRLVWQF